MISTNISMFAYHSKIQQVAHIENFQNNFEFQYYLNQ